MKYIFNIINKVRIAYLLMLVILLPKIILGKITTAHAPKHIQYFIQAEFHYKIFIGNTYIEPKPYNYGDAFANHQYERFTKKPTLGFGTGLAFSYRINNHFEIYSGLLYSYRKDIYLNNQDTVIKYGNSSTIRDIHNVFKYNYTNHNIEIPLMIKFSKNKLAFYTGCYVSTLTYKNANYTYLINNFSNNPKWTTSNKTISGFELPLKLFPVLQLSYQFQLNNKIINPFISLLYAMKNQADLYFQLGINYPILNNKNNKSIQ